MTDSLFTVNVALTTPPHITTTTPIVDAHLTSTTAMVDIPAHTSVASRALTGEHSRTASSTVAPSNGRSSSNDHLTLHTTDLVTSAPSSTIDTSHTQPDTMSDPHSNGTLVSLSVIEQHSSEVGPSAPIAGASLADPAKCHRNQAFSMRHIVNNSSTNSNQTVAPSTNLLRSPSNASLQSFDFFAYGDPLEYLGASLDDGSSGTSRIVHQRNFRSTDLCRPSADFDQPAIIFLLYSCCT